MADSLVVDGSLIVLPNRKRQVSGQATKGYIRPEAVSGDFKNRWSLRPVFHSEADIEPRQPSGSGWRSYRNIGEVALESDGLLRT